MNNHNKAATTLLLITGILMFSSVARAEGKIYIVPEVAHTAIEVNSSFLPQGGAFEDFDEEDSIYGANLTIGYRTSFNLEMEVGGGESLDIDSFILFDSYELEERRIAIGYSAPVSDSFRIAPKLGLYRWELQAQEGVFLNPGPEERIRERGREAYFELDLDIRFTDVLGLSIALHQINTDFGHVRTARVGLQLEF